MTGPALALPLEFARPAWLWLALAVVPLAVISWRSLAAIERPRRALAIVVRSLLIVLLALCLGQVHHVQHSDELTTIFLMDRSYSTQALERFQEDFVREAAETMPPEDRLGLIDFARDAYVEQSPMRGDYFIAPGRLPPMPDTDRTNISAAMRLAMALFPHDTAKRIVLMSDGNDNMGDVLTEARRAHADGIPVDVVPLWYERPNEIFFEKIIAPTYAEPGEQVPLRMAVHAEAPASARITIFQDGKLLELPAEQTRVNLKAETNSFYIKLPVTEPGAHTFTATIEPEDPSMDATAVNNTAGAFTFVSGQSRVLVLSQDRTYDTPLVDALRSENVKVDFKTTAELGEFGLLQMMNYASIVLANIPAASFTEDQQKELAAYVRDMGSGLIMTGGDEGFGAGGWIGTPVEEVMPVSFEIKHKKVIPRGALVLIMHSCEIPRGNYWGKEMAKKSVDTISSQDYIGVLAYTFSPGGETWEVPLGTNTNRAAVKAKIDRMQIGDMPDFGTTMQLAYDELVKGVGRDAAQKHVIILSDGDAQPPSGRLLNAYAGAKITVSTIAIGWGAHVMPATLQNVAQKTGGRFYQARNPRQLPQIFSKESKVVRRPLIINDPFQPQILHAYSELLAGISAREAIPPLDGMVLTSPKESPNVIIPLIRATEDGEDPVLAHWQYELGKTVTFTSGYWPTWGRSWAQWPKFAKLWAQIVRWTMRQEAPANFDTYTRIEGDKAYIAIDAIDKDATYLNLLQLRANVVGPDKEPRPIEFTQTGPGHYEAAIEIEDSGQYLANVQAYDAAGTTLGTLRTGFSVPFSPEYRDLRPNESLLRQVADITGGRWLDLPAADANVFSHDLPVTTARRPAWDWILAWLLLPLFLMDVAVRRLASWLALSIVIEVVVLVVLLFGVGLIYTTWWGVLGAFLLAELIGWAIRFRYIGPLFDWLTHTVTALGTTGERSAVALEKLKGARDRARGGFSPPEEAQEEGPAVAPEIARRRFDVGERRGKQPAGDLSEAVGGARTSEDQRERMEKESASEGQDQSTTSRLLRAKRRSQENPDE